jgi:hypothetical protein
MCLLYLVRRMVVAAITGMFGVGVSVAGLTIQFTFMAMVYPERVLG